MSTVLTTSLISHAARNKNGISINREECKWRADGDSWVEVCVSVCVYVCRLARAVCHCSL